MKRFDAIIEKLLEARSFGYTELANGTKLVGHVSHVAPEAWLHGIFPPLNEKEVQWLEEKLQASVPHEYKSFLALANGLALFSDSLSLDGLRKSFSRVGDEVWQPFSIMTPNIEERPSGAKDNYFFIGGYGFDGSLLFIDGSIGTVHRCTSKSAKRILKSWDSFWIMLEQEVHRLAKLFDERGKLKSPRKLTVPM